MNRLTQLLSAVLGKGMRQRSVSDEATSELSNTYAKPQTQRALQPAGARARSCAGSVGVEHSVNIASGFSGG
jgi:hypothetical protein